MPPPKFYYHQLRRREFIRTLGAGFLAFAFGSPLHADDPEQTNIIQFEETLASWRKQYYSHRKVDIIKTGFRPVGGKVADFAVAEHKGQFHSFYTDETHLC